jgi:hypothetical protein
MKRLFLAAAGLATLGGLAGFVRPDVGHAQNPETISVPVTQPVGAQPPVGIPSGIAPLLKTEQQVLPGSYLPTTSGYQQFPVAPAAGGGKDNVYLGSSNRQSSLKEYLNQSLEKVAINNDVAVHKDCGPWMICVNWYSGPEAPQMANELCLYLRNNPDYRLQAYVFTKGLDERKQELDRIAKYVEEQRERLRKAGLPTDTPIRVPLTRYEIECAVLVGGYRDMEAAHCALEQMKKLKPPDPNQVKMHTEFVIEFDKTTGKAKSGSYLPVNPFTRGMVVHNPTDPVNHATGLNDDDLRLLRLLNEDESFSLLQCRKPYTLVVKQFSLPMVLQPKKSTGSLLDSIGLGSSSSEKLDQAKINAHNMADMLRKTHLEAYALHMKHCSYVCVGSYDSKDDARARLDQERLPQQLNPQLKDAVKLVAHPMVMEIPR